jgi:Fe-S-cluster-containing hydrogenase component 2
MSRIFSRHSSGRTNPKTLKLGLVPVIVELVPGHSALVTFSDGSTSESTCLRCETAPCMTYADAEIVSASLANFPSDRNPSVCPANAITRENGAAPIISSDACMLCGVCASRCSVGAIRMDPYAFIDDTQREAFPETENLDESLAALSVFKSVPKSGDILVETDAIVDDLHMRLQVAWKSIGDRFPDHLARNLLITAGVGAAMRRKGDNAVRMDIVLGAPWPVFGCAEAEFGDVAVLDAPRDLMDDVAVCVGRYGKDKDSILALVVTDVLPNRRSEYWRILQDIRNVLGVKISTVSVLALCLLVWRRKKISAFPIDFFHVDIDTRSYRTEVLEPLVGGKINLGLELRPWVEVAK